MTSVLMEYEVPFFDVDSYRIVWHGNYPKYFEMSRCQLLEAIGCPYEVMEQQGYFFPVIDMRIKYVKPIIFKQKVLISSELLEWENRLKIKYRIKDAETNEVLTKAETCQVAVQMPEQITQYVSPQFLLDKVNQWLDTDAN